MTTGGERGSAGDDGTAARLAGRRRALTIAVADYEDGDEDFSKAVFRQLEMIGTWWCDPDLGRRRFVLECAEPLGTRRDVEDFLHHSAIREAAADDVLFVFVAGHGATATSGRHFLSLPDSDHARIMVTAFPTAEVAAAALGSHAEHVLVIVNACDAGGIDKHIVEMARDLSPWRRETGVLAVLATAEFDQSVPIGAFGVALERLYQRLRTVSGITTEYLSLNDFLSELSAVVRSDADAGLRTVRTVLSFNEDKPHKALPNPGYRPPDDLVAPRLRQLAVARSEMDYWISRASGAGESGASDGRWYFSGRRALTRQLARFLTHGPRPGHAPTLIITGTAGSGKSAVIGRAVTFSDPGFRTDTRYQAALHLAPPDTVPPSGSIKAALLARNRDAHHILIGLLTALGQPIPAPEPGVDHIQSLRHVVSEALTRADTPVSVVIDGLDEAENPYLLITQVIAPLAQLETPPRLIIGVRSSLPADGGATGAVTDQLLELLLRATTIGGLPPQQQRTDGKDTPAAISEYLQAMLDNTPAAGLGAAQALLAHLPDKNSFLDARIAALQLRDAHDPIRLLHDPQWLDGLHLGTVGLLRQDLADAAGPDLSEHTALALLRATAFALGAGIPRADIWPAIAEAVGNQPIADADSAIEALLGGRLSGYLIADREADRTVYRPLHERLAEVLRHHPHLLHATPEQP